MRMTKKHVAYKQSECSLVTIVNCQFFYLPGAVLIVGDFSLSENGERPIVRRRGILVVAQESLRRLSPDVAVFRPQVGFVRRRIGVVRRPMKSATISPETAKNDLSFRPAVFHTTFQSHRDLFGSSWSPFPTNLQLSTPA